MKRILCTLMVLLMLPFTVLADLEMDVEKNYITFPQLDGMTGYFRSTAKWIIVHQDNLEEHLAFLVGRGESEEAIRARFAEDTLLWEAYFDGFPEDACLRMERFVNETSRDVWHLRHLSTAERRDFLALANDGRLLEKYDTFAAKYGGNGGESYIDCGFTTIPPAAHESGRMYIRYINGQEYVMTYAVRDRMAGRSSLRSKRENEYISRSPFRTLKFGVKLQPKLTAFTLDEAFPQQADTGDVTVRGKITGGGKLRVTLDGREIPGKVTSGGAFTVTLPLTAPGDHEVVFTATHKKHTDRIETFTVNASARRTPLTITAQPEAYAPAGDQRITGASDPGAEILLRLDDREAVTLTADEAGAFTHVFEVMDDQVHHLYIAASAPGKDVSLIEVPFITEYDTFKDGTREFEKDLTEHTVAELSGDPDAHRGERVKISVRVQDVTYTRDGLGILCTYNPPKGSRHAKTPLYLTLYGYGQDQITPGMIMTVYGTVTGRHAADGEERLAILLQYGTYLR